ncbi:MAG: hypothetical protein KC800_25980 [Candidatus Eremiobacteraeota bacterium]|nr:hypothetical protein [Candidatus Eremiobacteraeota bacterium]
MICLHCGTTVKKSGATECPSCKGEFRYVSGLFGTNNVSQLLQALEDCGQGRIDADEVKERFGNFLEVWDRFAEKWSLLEQSVPDRFRMPSELEAVYGQSLEKIEEAVEQLNSAVAYLESLDELEKGDLEELDTSVRMFSRLICSSGAALFTKLESRGGDFDSLLEMFEQY